MAVRQYIGARYVPTYYQNSQDPTSSEWEPNVQYDPLTVVSLPNMHSYQSKKMVPANIGSPALNPEYWYDQGYAQAYYQALQDQIDDMKDGTVPGSLQEQIDTNSSDITALANGIDIEFFRNKKIVIAGDSLSNETINPDNWVTLLRNKLSAVNCTIDNISFGGSSWADGSTPGSGMVGRITSYDFSDVDILIIEEGTNDCTGQMALGSWSSTTGTTTFISSMWTAFNYIASNNPDLNVYWVVPSKRNLDPAVYPTPVPINVYRSVIKNMCNYFNWKLIDWNCGLQNLNPTNGNIRTHSMGDNLHINAAFAPYVTDYVIEKLKSGGDTNIGGIQNQLEYTTFDSNDVTGVFRMLFDTNANLEIELQLTVSNITGAQKLFDYPQELWIYKPSLFISTARYFYGIEYISGAIYLIPFGTVPSDTVVGQLTISLDKFKPKGGCL